MLAIKPINRAKLTDMVPIHVFNTQKDVCAELLDEQLLLLAVQALDRLDDDSVSERKC